MKRSTFLLGFVLLCSLLSAGSVKAEVACSRVAKIDYRKIEDLLREVVLANPERSELKSKYEAYKDRQKAQQKKMMKRAMEARKTGEMTLKFDELANQSDGYEVEAKVRELARDECARIVEEVFGKEYDLILEGSWGKEVLYSKIPIPDITAKFRQYLLKEK